MLIILLGILKDLYLFNCDLFKKISLNTSNLNLKFASFNSIINSLFNFFSLTGVQ
jgi:hypothetical protein